jgi:pyruvate kinase
MTPRKTKIICTIGPASESVDMLCKLINAGMDIARLNFSHGSHDEHLKTIENIRKASDKAGRQIAIMQDLQGPKIRTEFVQNGAVNLENQQEFIITTDDIELGNSNIVSTSYKDLTKDVKAGNTLLLDDGYLILKVNKVTGNNIYTTVIKGGLLKNRKGIIAPGVSFSAPSISDKDLEDLKFGLSAGIDVVALSFVRSVRDIYELKTTMKIFGRIVPIVAKIERPEAISCIEEIIEEVDAVMVARGDLGLEVPPEEVPLLQKQIIKKCNFHGKPVITATQMLESMIQNPRPSRAEASDVANAVIDGTDCVMLSGETSVGAYPIESVNYMARIVKTIEEDYYSKEHNHKFFQHLENDVSDALGHASCVIADQINAAAIVTLTTSTFTAKNIAKYRPRIPIIGLTDDAHVHRRLNFVWGVTSILIPDNSELITNFEQINEYLKSINFINIGDNIVYVAGLHKSNVANQNVIKVYQM